MRVLLSAASIVCAFILVTTTSAAEAAVSAHGSVRQVYATGVAPDAQMTLVGPRGRAVANTRADGLGGVLFRGVRPGRGYRVRPSGGGRMSRALRVLPDRSAPPSTAGYGQKLPTKGYGYLTTRDGTKLAIAVRPPVGGAPASGVTPTLVEYSGYGYADPAGPQSGIAVIANLMGFTVVDVNMRGTGCSGGAFDYFEPLQGLDGYDVIETVARQPWVAHHKVGMMGVSYGGISQLFTARTRPPSLAAISPLSTIDSTQTTLYPGGVLNTGFAVQWAKERVHDALPASKTGGQAYALKRIQGGDRTCKANQVLHGQAVNLLHKIRANAYYVPKVADPLAPVTFVKDIDVPVYLACQWTDEQTGGHCPDLAEHFTGTRQKWFTFTNGTHIDSLDPETFNRWYDFLELYVAREAPMTQAAGLRAAAPAVYAQAMGVSGVTLPPDPVQEQPTYAGALQAFERQPSVRVLFDNGAGSSGPGKPQPGFEQSFDRFPLPGTSARTWYLGAPGDLGAQPPARTGTGTFTWDAAARPLTDFTGDTAGAPGGLWTATPTYDWIRPPAGSALAYQTEPLPATTTVVGAGAVRVWVRSSKPRVDLQATVSEIRPDGKETFVQSGWVRGDERKLDPRKSTPLEPVLSLRRADRAPLPAQRFVPITIPLYYQGHVYRAGSRIRLTVSAPNGDQPVWAFANTRPRGKATVAITASASRPSGLTLPVIAGVNVPTGLPPCPSLRGEPCRDAQPIGS